MRMKRNGLMKKIMTILLSGIFLMMLFCAPQNTLAAEMTVDGVEVTLTTDADSYEEGDVIKGKLTIKNTNPFAITDFTAEIFFPSGYELQNVKDIPSNITLNAGKSKTYNTPTIGTFLIY